MLRSTSTATTTSRGLSATAASPRSQLIELTPFDVQIARTSNATAINEALLMSLVTNWMTIGFNQSITSKGLVGYATFQSLLLTQLGQRRVLMEADNDSGEEEEEDVTDFDNDWQLLLQRDLGQQQQQQQIFTVSYQIYSVWLQQQSTDVTLPTAIIVGLESQVLLDPNKKLLTALQQQDSSTGLGSDVTNVWAFLLPTGTGNSSSSNPVATTNANSSSSSSHNNLQLEVIIIVAVVVAGVALSVLSLAVVWAWRQDRKRRDPYRREGAEDGDESGADGAASNHSKRGGGDSRHSKRMSDPKRSHAPSPDGTGSSSTPPPRGVSAAAAARIVSPPPSEIEHSEHGGGVYEESLISEDISTSLSAYYRSGLAVGSGHTNNTMTLSSDHYGSNFNNNNNHPDRLNDAASLSSMESYGYSLDGYNSITGASLQPPSVAASGANKSKTTTTTNDVMPSAGEIRRVIDED